MESRDIAPKPPKLTQPNDTQREMDVQLLDVTLRDGGFPTVHRSDVCSSSEGLRSLFADLREEREADADDDLSAGARSRWRGDFGFGASRGAESRACSAIFWGTSASGGSVAVVVDSVRPVGYVRAHPRWESAAGATALARELVERIDGVMDDVRVSFKRHRRLWGWKAPSPVSPDGTTLWARLSFRSIAGMRRLARSLDGNGRLAVMVAGVGRVGFPDVRLEEDGGRQSPCFEHKAFDVTGFPPGTWVRLAGRQSERRRATLADAEFRVGSTRELRECRGRLERATDAEARERAHGGAQAPFTVAYFDIECASPTRAFPDHRRDSDRVVVIGVVVAVHGSERRRSFVLCRGRCGPVEGAEVRPFESERALLRGWVALLRECDVSFLVGYNSTQFDLPYIAARASHLGVQRDMCLGLVGADDGTRQLGSQGPPEGSGGGRRGKGVTGGKLLPVRMQAPGIYHVDLYKDIFEDTTVRLPQYKLEDVSRHFLGEGKVGLGYDEMFDLIDTGSASAMARVGEYCLQDCDLLRKIDGARKAITRVVQTSTVSTAPLGRMLDKATQFKTMCLLAWYARRDAQADADTFVLTPAPRGTPFADDGYQGATVVQPVPGFYEEPIITLDFASLYPSIMDDLNFCPSTRIVGGRDLERVGAGWSERESGGGGDGQQNWTWTPCSAETAAAHEARFAEEGLPAPPPREIDAQQWVAADLDEGNRRSTLFSLRAEGDGAGTDQEHQEHRGGKLALQPMQMLRRTPWVREFGDTRFVTREQASGLVPRVLSMLVQRRRAVKRRMAQAEPGTTAHDRLNSEQVALKIMANSIYGFFGVGADKALLPCPWLAASVTFEGRRMISKVVDHMDAEYDAETVYGDTDSVFLRLRRALDGVSAMSVCLVGCTAASLDHIAFGAAVAHCLGVGGDRVRIASVNDGISMYESDAPESSGAVVTFEISCEDGDVAMRVERLMCTAEPNAFKRKAIGDDPSTEIIETDTGVADANMGENAEDDKDGAADTIPFVVSLMDALQARGLALVRKVRVPRGGSHAEQSQLARMRRAFEIGARMAETSSALFGSKISLELEKVWDPLLLRKEKKRYCGLLWECPETPRGVETKGIESKRRDNANFARKLYEDVICRVIERKDVDGALLLVQGEVDRLLSGETTYADLTITRKLQEEADYSAPDTQPVVKLSRKLAQRGLPVPAAGSRVPFVVLPATTPGALLADRVEDPDYAERRGLAVDVEYYLEKQLNAPISKFFDSMGDELAGRFTGIVEAAKCELFMRRTRQRSVASFVVVKGETGASPSGSAPREAAPNTGTSSTNTSTGAKKATADAAARVKPKAPPTRQQSMSSFLGEKSRAPTPLDSAQLKLKQSKQQPKRPQQQPKQPKQPKHARDPTKNTDKELKRSGANARTPEKTVQASISAFLA